MQKLTNFDKKFSVFNKFMPNCTLIFEKILLFSRNLSTCIQFLSNFSGFVSNPREFSQIFKRNSQILNQFHAL